MVDACKGTFKRPCFRHKYEWHDKRDVIGEGTYGLVFRALHKVRLLPRRLTLLHTPLSLFSLFLPQTTYLWPGNEETRGGEAIQKHKGGRGYFDHRLPRDHGSIYM